MVSRTIVKSLTFVHQLLFFPPLSSFGPATHMFRLYQSDDQHTTKIVAIGAPTHPHTPLQALSPLSAGMFEPFSAAITNVGIALSSSFCSCHPDRSSFVLFRVFPSPLHPWPFLLPLCMIRPSIQIMSMYIYPLINWMELIGLTMA